MQELQGRVVRAAETGSAEELMRVGKEIVDFHGEMVLLVNYSALNYTGELFFFIFAHYTSGSLKHHETSKPQLGKVPKWWAIFNPSVVPT
jgi:hypothetical protein